MKIRLDKADKTFSYYIRLRDGECVRCKSLVKINLESGLPKSHHASHYYGRGKESVRFDGENVDTLCFGCHQEWGSDDREAYREFKLNQLGERGFNALMVRASTFKKKDRKMEHIIAKELLKSVL